MKKSDVLDSRCDSELGSSGIRGFLEDMATTIPQSLGECVDARVLPGVFSCTREFLLGSGDGRVFRKVGI